MRPQVFNQAIRCEPRVARNLPGAGGIVIGGTLSLALWAAIAGVVHALV